jgi:hypothetical protein
VDVWFASGTVRVPAENIKDRWVITMPSGESLLLADVLRVLGFDASWEAETKIVMANKRVNRA